jgi:hypothetical protein
MMTFPFTLIIFISLFLSLGASAIVIWTLSQRRKREKFLSMRRHLKKQRQLELAQHGVVRAIDMLRLSRDDDSKRQHALKLIEDGQIVEGARTLESLGLHRTAISTLETHHKIDEAAEILLRMSRPNRAGVVYQRNEMPAKAAECFLLANMPEDAARCFMEAGKWDSRCYKKAADLYEDVGKVDLALRALSEGGHLAALVHLAFKYESFPFLSDFMSTEQHSRNIFALMDPSQVKKFARSLPLNQDQLERVGMWCQSTQNSLLFVNVLSQIVGQPSLQTFYWKLFSEEFLISHISQVRSFLETHSNAAALSSEFCGSLEQAEQLSALRELSSIRGSLAKSA